MSVEYIELAIGIKYRLKSLTKSGSGPWSLQLLVSGNELPASSFESHFSDIYSEVLECSVVEANQAEFDGFEFVERKSENYMFDISGLQFFTNLKVLHLLSFKRPLKFPDNFVFEDLRWLSLGLNAKSQINLKRLPDFMPNIRRLDLEVKEIPEINLPINQFEHLSQVFLSSRSASELPHFSSSSSTVSHLWINGFEFNGSLSLLCGFPNLKTLEIEDCKGLNAIGRASESFNLKELSLSNCPDLKDVNIMVCFPELEELCIFDCQNIRDLSGLGFLGNLRDLWVDNTDLGSIFLISETLGSLKNLTIENCESFCSLNQICGLVGLVSLDLVDCNNLLSLEGLDKLICLQSIEINGCNALEDLRGIESVKSLREIRLVNNLRLESIRHLLALEPCLAIEIVGTSNILDLFLLTHESGNAYLNQKL